MESTDRQTLKKTYKKPLVTLVRLEVEHNMLNGCHAGNPNMSGEDALSCFQNLTCKEQPTV